MIQDLAAPCVSGLDRYRQTRHWAEILGRELMIPFTLDASGTLLGVRPGGSGDLYLMLDDTGNFPYDRYPDIQTLVAETVEGLRGNSDDYRAELTDQYLSWINLEEEADDHDR